MADTALRTILMSFAVPAMLAVTPVSLKASGPDALPDQIMSEVAWSFAEPVPVSIDDLVIKLDAYAKSIQSTLDRHTLQILFPGNQLDIQYDYGVQRPDGRWDTIHEVVRVRGHGKPLTNAEILLQLHKAAHRHLENDDHHFFEGLHRLDRSFETGVPAYEVYLGS